MTGPFPREFVEDVRNAGDIVRLVSEYVPLKTSGKRMRGLCPFHQEKTPSFYVDPDRGLFYCFGCQTGGDLFKFVMLYEKVDFREAAELLANRFGVPLPVSGGPVHDFRVRVLEMNRVAEEFFRARLSAGDGAGCRTYLERRGLGESTIASLRLGYAPDSWEALRAHLVAKRFKPDEIVKAGLALPRKSGQGEYDRFRDRLIFPIRDVNGRTVAFGGRALGDAEPKYLNSPETPAYVKGNHLYGLDLARDAIRREGFAIVVEGYMDLAALLGAGFDNVVASLGTAFTPAQARLLARYAERIVLSYDGDASGATATARSMDLLLERGFNVRVAELPEGRDPDDTIAREGADAYGALVRRAPEYLEFLIRRASHGRDLSRVEHQVSVVNAVLPHVARLESAVERAAWAGRLADSIGIEDELVLQELRKALRSRETRIRQRPPGSRPLGQAEARLVSLLLGSSEARAELVDHGREVENSHVAGIVAAILRLDGAGRAVDYPAVLDALEDEADKKLLTRLAFRDEPENGPGVADCLWALQRRRLAQQGREELSRLAELQGAEPQSPEAGELDDHLLRIQELARQRDALS